MSKDKKYKLTGSGSVTYEGSKGTVTHERGDEISEDAFKKVPSRQQDFFTPTDEIVDEPGEEGPSREEMMDMLQEQQATIARLEKKVDGQPASEDEGKDAPSLEEQVSEDFTVEELQDELNKAEVDYNSKANKPDLVALYIEHIHEAE